MQEGQGDGTKVIPMLKLGEPIMRHLVPKWMPLKELNMCISNQPLLML
jgi:hypothetical protein